MQDNILQRPMKVEVNERNQAYVVVSASQAKDLKAVFDREEIAYSERETGYTEDFFFDFGPDEDLVRVQAVLDDWPTPPHPLV